MISQAFVASLLLGYAGRVVMAVGPWCAVFLSAANLSYGNALTDPVNALEGAPLTLLPFAVIPFDWTAISRHERGDIVDLEEVNADSTRHSLEVNAAIGLVIARLEVICVVGCEEASTGPAFVHRLRVELLVRVPGQAIEVLAVVGCCRVGPTHRAVERSRPA